MTQSSLLEWASDLSSLPSSPGVYWFSDAKNKILYVGKAKNLKKRIRSYTQIKRLDERIKNLVLNAKKIQYQNLESELEALLIEAELIRLHQPEYNILLKDDKTPIYILITQERFPRVLKIRKKELLTQNPKGKVLGPFSSVSKLNEVLKIARKIFPWCDQAGKNKAKKKNKKSCFYHQLQLCSGACVGKISAKDYQEMIKELVLFLKGKKKTVTNKLNKKMKKLAQELKFEKANEIKQKIALIKEVTSKYYHLKPEYILPALQTNTAKYRLLHLYKLIAGYMHLPKNYQFTRIEGYDVSNIQGKNASVSMVVFEEAEPKKSGYRLFNIKNLDTPNDYQMMKQAIKRRSKHKEWPEPNLLVIDGGKGQVRAAIKAWSNPPCIGLVKNPDRVVIPLINKEKIDWKLIKLKSDHPALQLVQQIRDESHRFAKKQHARLRLRNFLPSTYKT